MDLTEHACEIPSRVSHDAAERVKLEESRADADVEMETEPIDASSSMIDSKPDSGKSLPVLPWAFHHHPLSTHCGIH
jgi:hypothetical protein